MLNKMSRFVNIENFGKISYHNAMIMMKKKVGQHLSLINEPINNNVNKLNCLMLIEHNPVYTVGFREVKNLAINEKERLKKLGADFEIADRAGLVTFHGPGQLVVYPILNLRNFDISIKDYIYNLEEIGIKCCNHFNINAIRTKNPGVWIGNNKIASIGVRNQNLITSHGISFNCNVNLNWFSHIVPCGLLGKGTTSLTFETQKNITVEQFKPIFLKYFKNLFKC